MHTKEKPGLPILEQRSITFNATEILRAIIMLPQVAKALGLPAAGVHLTQFQPDRGNILFALAGETERTMTVGAEALAALLVAYCRKNGIPLPRHGNKTIEMTPDSVTLHIAANMDQHPGAAAWKRRLPL